MIKEIKNISEKGGINKPKTQTEANVMLLLSKVCKFKTPNLIVFHILSWIQNYICEKSHHNAFLFKTPS